MALRRSCSPGLFLWRGFSKSSLHNPGHFGKTIIEVIIVKKNQFKNLLQNKLVLAALLMVLVAGTAAAGVMALQKGQSGEQDEEQDPGYAFQTEEEQAGNQQLQLPENETLEGLQDLDSAQNQLQLPDGEEQEAGDASQGHPVQSDDVSAVTDPKTGAEDILADGQTGLENALAEGSAGDAQTLVDGENAVVYEPETDAEAVAAPGTALDFQEGSTITWPVYGNIILDYSMDTTTYFSTLKQYKCNPGILIQAEVGQPVEAAVRGQVTAVGTDEELGNFIMMDLGGDYSIVYGQLEDLTVSVGQLVEAGEILGVVAEPTKYYVVEGPNIYLELRYHQEPVDPLDYIR